MNVKAVTLGAALALGLATAAQAQVVEGQPITPCMITKVQPADATVGHNYNLVWCGPTVAYASPASTYSNVANPEIWVTLGSPAAIGRMLTADFGPLGFVSIVGSTVIAQYINNVAVQ